MPAFGHDPDGHLKLPQVWSVKIPHLKQDLDVVNLPLFHEQELQRPP